ncbi:LysR substrate-binding domain-containing protein [Bradyrhizobium huanghuaihaiense]|uniref:LysR substrate-binding domain-containing protein n=1 Tax=Bradyrhizobium huanghuaihaiense TaxID=990078 RepID=UPI0021AA8C49|nr:LysR substrate-binding domain-containing protein [Bradyrhizobium sp. CB3035]UWU75852.1 LysR substrate-binding domain-containing protein [Bradyrhizobium sp. CB3035]
MLSRRVIPPTNLLVTFCVTAKYCSVVRASEDLNLAQSAVCRQVQKLEDLLGVKMFERVKKRLVLTEAGRAYAETVRPLLDAIASASPALTSLSDENILNIAILPTIGSHWLAPRIRSFHDRHPDIVIRFTNPWEPFDFGVTAVDAAILSYEDGWQGATLDFLADDILVTVCSSAYAEEHGLREEGDLDRCSLLQLHSRDERWPLWFEQGGLPRKAMHLGPSYQLHSMMTEAAVSGLGVALATIFLVERELETGHLIVPLPRTFKSSVRYYLAYPRRTRSIRAFQAFRDWLLSEAKSLPTAGWQPEVAAVATIPAAGISASGQVAHGH